MTTSPFAKVSEIFATATDRAKLEPSPYRPPAFGSQLSSGISSEQAMEDIRSVYAKNQSSAKRMAGLIQKIGASSRAGRQTSTPTEQSKAIDSMAEITAAALEEISHRLDEATDTVTDTDDARMVMAESSETLRRIIEQLKQGGA